MGKYLCEMDLTFHMLAPEMLLGSQYSHTNIVHKVSGDGREPISIPALIHTWPHAGPFLLKGLMFVLSQTAETSCLVCLKSHDTEGFVFSASEAFQQSIIVCAVSQQGGPRTLKASLKTDTTYVPS